MMQAIYGMEAHRINAMTSLAIRILVVALGLPMVERAMPQRLLLTHVIAAACLCHRYARCADSPSVSPFPSVKRGIQMLSSWSA
jgi:hypothetical protein